MKDKNEEKKRHAKNVVNCKQNNWEKKEIEVL